MDHADNQQPLFATADTVAAASEELGYIRALLDRVRVNLGMDVVFVSEFLAGRRVFRHVSGAAQAGKIIPGASDPVEDTYCMRIVDGRLPHVIRDTGAIEESRDLPITEMLNIRAYLSAPIVSASGAVLGTVCCVSHRRRFDLQDVDAESLRVVATMMANHLSQMPVVAKALRPPTAPRRAIAALRAKLQARTSV